MKSTMQRAWGTPNDYQKPNEGTPLAANQSAPQPLSEISWSHVQALCKDLFNLRLLADCPSAWKDTVLGMAWNHFAW